MSVLLEAKREDNLTVLMQAVEVLMHLEGREQAVLSDLLFARAMSCMIDLHRHTRYLFMYFNSVTVSLIFDYVNFECHLFLLSHLSCCYVFLSKSLFFIPRSDCTR